MRQMNAAGGRDHDPGGIHAVIASQNLTAYSRRGRGGQRQEGGATGINSNYVSDRHFVKDSKCPARDKTCEKCKKRGHFAKCGETKDFNANGYSENKKLEGHVNNVNIDSSEDEYNVNEVKEENGTCNPVQEE